MILTIFTFKMAASNVPTSSLPPMSLQPNIANQVSSPRGGPLAAVQNAGGDANVFPEAGKVRELALQLHSCLFQAQQLKMAAVQQQPSAPANQQVKRDSICVQLIYRLVALQIAQAEEISSRLKEAILELQEAAHGMCVGLPGSTWEVGTQLMVLQSDFGWCRHTWMHSQY